MLQSISESQIASAAADPVFLGEVERLVAARRRFVEASGWFQTAHPNHGLAPIAYFSMEFMLSEALPIYSGGLGNVSGDHLKTASDLGVPIVGVGLLYEQGYFRQEIDAEGRQRAVFPFNEPGALPILRLRSAGGAPVRFTIPMGDTEIHVRAWYAQIGRTRLYLLDTNDPVNSPTDRQITSELYGGDAEQRLRQEIVLGIGGWRLLGVAGVPAEVCHLNEGHAALAVLERARTWMAPA